MKLEIKKFKINIEIPVMIVIVLMIFSVKIRNYLYNYYICFLFIAFHEFSHMLVASLFGIKTTELNIRLNGLSIRLNVCNVGRLKKLLIYIAGPLANVFLATFFCNIKFINEINIALAVINLVPIYPLDGFNILDTILCNNNHKNKAEVILQYVVLLLIFVMATVQIITTRNISLFLLLIYIILINCNNEDKHNTEIYQKYYKNVTNILKNY